MPPNGGPFAAHRLEDRADPGVGATGQEMSDQNVQPILQHVLRLRAWVGQRYHFVNDPRHAPSSNDSPGGSGDLPTELLLPSCLYMQLMCHTLVVGEPTGEDCRWATQFAQSLLAYGLLCSAH